MLGSGLREKGERFRIQGLASVVRGSGFRNCGLKFRV